MSLEHIDLMRDEFQRIASCEGATDEIKQLCERAINNTDRKIPVIKELEETISKKKEASSLVEQMTIEINSSSDDFPSVTMRPALWLLWEKIQRSLNVKHDLRA